MTNKLIYQKYAIVVLAALLLGSCSQSISGINKIPKEEIEEKYSEPDPKALELFMDAQLLMSQENYPQAIVNLQDAQRIDPNVSTIYVALGECYGKIGKLELAEERLLKAIELDPDEKDAYTILAHVYLSMQNFSKAEDSFISLQKLDPDNPEVLYALADIMRYQKKYNKAIDYYIKAYYLYPESIRALELATELSFKSKDMALSQKIYSIMVAADPNNIQFLKTFADLAFINNDTTSGINAVKKASNLKSSTVKDKIRFGAVLFEFNMVDSSLNVFSTILDNYPDNAEALHFVSQIYRSESDLLTSNKYAKKLVEAHPNDPRGYVDIALNAFDQDKPEYIVELLSASANKFENNFSIQYMLGMAYYLLKNDSSALEYLNNSVELNSNANQAWHAIATIEEKNKNFKISDDIYVTLISRDSTDAQAYNNYAYSLVERNINIEKARIFASRAVKLSPENAAYLDTFGWIQFKIGNLEKALEFIKKSAELSGKNEVILEHLGDVYKAMNNETESIKLYKMVLKINPDNKSIKEKLEN